MSDVVKVLRDARASLATPGVWAQGGDALCKERLCAGLALCRSVPGPDYLNALRLLGFANSDEIMAWNDSPGRTQAEVLAAFDRAIALAESPTNG